MARGGTVDGGLVRELNPGSESSCVGSVNIGGDIRGRFDGVIAGDVDPLDEGVEMASGDVIGVVPVDHASSPLNGTLGSSVNTGGPHAGVGVWVSVSFSARGKQKGAVPYLDTSGSAWVKSDSIRVDGIGPLQGANHVSINQPCQSIRLPVNLSNKWI